MLPLPIRAPLLQAITVILALLFSLPGCFTVMLWSPPKLLAPKEGIQRLTRSVEVPAMWHQQDLVVALSADERARLSWVLPMLAEDTEVLLISAMPGHTLASMYAQSEGGAGAGAITVRIAVGLDGVVRTWVDRGVLDRSVPCLLAAVATMPADTIDSEQAQIAVERSVDHGSYTLQRVLWTPATLVVDAATSPLQVVFFLGLAIASAFD